MAKKPEHKWTGSKRQHKATEATKPEATTEATEATKPETTEATKPEATSEATDDKVWICSKGHSTPIRRGRGQKCQVCEEAKPATNRPTTNRPTTRNQTSGEIDIRKAIQAVKAMGGLATLKEKIKAADDALAILKAVGGLEQARTTAETIGDLLSLGK
jgi:hypothetical protein